jgi:hypothetical protein
MAKILSQIPIETGNTIEAWHVTQSIDAFTGVEAYDISLSGSLNITGSLTIKGLSTSSQSNVLTINSSTGNIFYTSSDAIVNLTAGTNVTINKVGTAYYISSSGGGVTGDFVTTSSFNAFTSSYTTGSFTGSFKGNLTGTASYVNLAAGPGITINQNGSIFAVSSSISTISTSSFLTTASISSNTITFTKGDNSTFPINLPNISADFSYTQSSDTIGNRLPPGTCIIISGSIGATYLLTNPPTVGDRYKFILDSSTVMGNSLPGNSIIVYYSNTGVITDGTTFDYIMDFGGYGVVTLTCIDNNIFYADITPNITYTFHP